MTKLAVRIVDGETGKRSLFAVCEEHNVFVFRDLARRTISRGSYAWISIKFW